MKRTASLLLLAALSAACQNTSHYEPPPAGSLPESEWADRVVFSVPVRNLLVVEEVREVRQNGLLRVQVDLRNVQQRQSSFRTLIEWFDAGGLKLDSPNEGWRSQILQANQKSPFGYTAVNPDAVSWRLNVDAWDR
jgi:hypothetical protein